MPTFDGFRQAVRSDFETRVTAYPVRWENEPFDPPVDAQGFPQPFLRFHFLEGEARNISFGTSFLYRHPGVFKVNIMTRSGLGAQQNRQIGDQVANAFRQMNLSNVFVKAPSYRSNGSDGAYWQGTVTCPFTYDLAV